MLAEAREVSLPGSLQLTWWSAKLQPPHSTLPELQNVVNKGQMNLSLAVSVDGTCLTLEALTGNMGLSSSQHTYLNFHQLHGALRPPLLPSDVEQCPSTSRGLPWLPPSQFSLAQQFPYPPTKWAC